MGLRASKANLKSVNSQNTLKSKIKKYQNKSKYEKRYEFKYEMSQAKLESLKDNKQHKAVVRQVSKVRFACSDETDNERSSSDTTDSNNNQQNNRTRTRVYRSEVFSVTCYDDTGNEDRKSPSTTKCTVSRVTSQITIKSSEDSGSEDEVFCEYSAISSDITDHNNNQQDTHTRTRIYKSTVSHLSVTCYDDIGNRSKRPSSDTTDYKISEQYTSENNCIRTVSQISVTCYEESCSKNATSPSHTCNCNNNKHGTDENEETETKKSTYKRRVSLIKLTCYTETVKENTTFPMNNVNMRDDSSKRRRKKTILHFYDAAIEVCRSQKEIAEYCLPLPTSQFIGQTTSSIHTDEVDTEGHESLHLGVYLGLMDSYIRHFTNPEEFTGTREYYLKLLRYIATKRQMPGENEDECYERLLGDSRRFVEIYHQRGGFSQELPYHKDYWGSRQQLLSSKVIADWIDKENGPLDPIFGALLQPTTGRAGPGDSGWLHHYLFDENGHIAYHSAVHDAFGYLGNYHHIGPGYDYLHHSMFKSSNPLAGQLDGMSFWKNVLKNIEYKQNVSDLTTGVLALLKGHPEKRNTVYF